MARCTGSFPSRSSIKDGFLHTCLLDFEEVEVLEMVGSGARSTTFAECCQRPPKVGLTRSSASLDKVSAATACRDEGDGVKVEEAVEAGVGRLVDGAAVNSVEGDSGGGSGGARVCAA